MRKIDIKETVIKFLIILMSIKNKIIHHHNNAKFDVFYYGKNKRQYYRVYNRKGSKKPLIVFIHGGGWWHGSPRRCDDIAKFFWQRGYTVILPAYRLAPLNTYPDAIDDVFKGLRLFINNNRIYDKPNNIIVMGFSAGGELSANLVFNKKKQIQHNIDKSIFKCMISFAGVLDFEKCKSGHAKTLIKNYIGKEENFYKANPINLINRNIEIPVLCIHGENDKLIDLESSISFIERINESGGKGIIRVIKGKYHSNITTMIMGKGTNESNIILDFINSNNTRSGGIGN